MKKMALGLLTLVDDDGAHKKKLSVVANYGMNQVDAGVQVHLTS